MFVIRSITNDFLEKLTVIQILLLRNQTVHHNVHKILPLEYNVSHLTIHVKSFENTQNLSLMQLTELLHFLTFEFCHGIFLEEVYRNRESHSQTIKSPTKIQTKYILITKHCTSTNWNVIFSHTGFYLEPR
jgi:hypothetical protein